LQAYDKGKQWVYQAGAVEKRVDIVFLINGSKLVEIPQNSLSTGSQRQMERGEGVEGIGRLLLNPVRHNKPYPVRRVLYRKLEAISL
jgi:hypothetical protein